MSKIDNPFNNILLTPTYNSNKYQLPETGIFDPDFDLKLSVFESEHEEELKKLKANATFVEVKWVIVNY